MAIAVCVGLAGVDYVGQVGRYPDADHEEEMQAFSLQGGGPAATAACTLATLGIPTRFIGKISDDDLGALIRRDLVDSGVDVSGLVVEAGRVSPWSFVALQARSARRTVFWTRGNVSPLGQGDVAPDAMAGARLLLVDGHQAAAQALLARTARARWMEVVLDAGGPRPGMDDLCRLATCIVASERYAAELGGTPEKALEAMLRLGARCAVVTLGEDGAVGVEAKGLPVSVPRHPVAAVDTTGAGDVFRGAFAYGILQGWDLKRKLHFANCAAALSTRALGGPSLPGVEEIERALDTPGSRR